MRVIAAGTGLLVALSASPRPADACSCGAFKPKISPPAAANGVPLNALVIVSYDWAADVAVTLRDTATNDVVPIVHEIRRPSDTLFGTTVFATPLAPLSPNTDYTIVVRTTYSPDETTTFTTGDGIDMTPPSFAGLSAITLETMDWPLPDEDGSICVSSCIALAAGHISRIRVDYPDPPNDAVHVALQLYRPGEGMADEVPVPSYDPRFFGYTSCTTLSPVLVPGADYCARMVAYDVAGNVAGIGSEVCATAQICEPYGGPVQPAGGFCEPSQECRPVSTAQAKSGGCVSTRSQSWLVFFVLALLLRKREGPERRSTLGPGFRDHPEGDIYVRFDLRSPALAARVARRIADQ